MATAMLWGKATHSASAPEDRVTVSASSWSGGAGRALRPFFASQLRVKLGVTRPPTIRIRTTKPATAARAASLGSRPPRTAA